MSKNARIDDKFKEWVINGPKNKESYIPQGNREKIIEWYDKNMKYLKTDNEKLLSRIKEGHKTTKEFFESQKVWASETVTLII